MNRPNLKSTWQTTVLPYAALMLIALGNTASVASDDDTSASTSGRQFEDFKIDTRVFVGDSDAPISSVQLFTERTVIDAQYAGPDGDEIREITVFDVDRRRFVLLDVERKIRMEIGHLQLLSFADNLRSELRQSEKTAFWLFQEPELVPADSDHAIAVRTDKIHYAAQGKRPEKPWVLSAYQRFLDQYTLLSVTDPHRMPPFARIRLNKAIKKNGIVPELVTLEVQSQDDSGQAFKAHSKHTVTHRLYSQDFDLIEAARRYQREFREVELAEYRRLAHEPAADSTDKP